MQTKCNYFQSPHPHRPRVGGGRWEVGGGRVGDQEGRGATIAAIAAIAIAETELIASETPTWTEQLGSN